MDEEGRRKLDFWILNGEELSAAALSEWKDTASSTSSPSKVPAVPLSEWTKTWLEEKLAALTVKLFGGSASASFAAPQVSGEVSSSMQEGRPVAAFLLRVECKWIIATSTGQSEGTLLIPEFTSEQGPEGSAVEVEASPGKKTSGQLLTALRQMGVSAVRTVLARFVSELQLQIKN